MTSTSNLPVQLFPFGATVTISDAPYQIHGSSLTVRGDRNIVSSALAIVIGSGNSINGSSVKVSGHNNRIFGTFAEVRGNQNAIEGSNNKVSGHHNRVSGYSAEVFGNYNVVEGWSAKATGDNNQVSGGFARVLGNNNTVHGDNASVTGGRNNAVFGSNVSVESRRNNRVNGISVENEEARQLQHRQQRIPYLQGLPYLSISQRLELTRLQLEQSNYEFSQLVPRQIPNRPVLQQVFLQQRPAPTLPHIVPVHEQRALIKLNLRGHDEECDTNVVGGVSCENNNDQEHCRCCLVNKAVVISVCCGKLTICNTCARQLYEGKHISQRNKCLNCQATVKHVVRIS